MPGKAWDEITYPTPHFIGATVDIWEWISNIIPRAIMGEINRFQYWINDENVMQISDRQNNILGMSKVEHSIFRYAKSLTVAENVYMINMEVAFVITGHWWIHFNKVQLCCIINF